MARNKSEAEIVFKATDGGLKDTLRGITSELTRNKAEMKLEQAQLQLTGSETEKLESKMGSLQKQYDLQGQKIEATSDRLENAKKYYGENSQEVAKLEKELINQQTAQQKTANEISKTEKVLSEAKGETKSYASEMKELDSEQKQLQASAGLVESEYKKWQATAGQSATESEKLAKAQEYVGKQSEIAEQKIEVMKRQLDATQKEFGDTSTEAMEMKAKLNDAEREFHELGQAADDIESSAGLESVGKKIDLNNLMNATDQLAEVGDKMIDVGKNAIEAAGNAKAMDAQFSQVFGKMKTDAQQSVDGMANTFGMLPNRVKPLYTQLTSMFKGLGYDTKDAMGLAEKATNSAADAAAFYDKSMEDASASLTSFVKGNYEGGESIGLFANDTQMAAYAAKNDLIPATEGAKKASEELLVASDKANAKLQDAIKKHGENSIEARDASVKLQKVQDKINEELGPQTQKWSDLDEATKQAVRLDYVQNMQKQSGALGQAAREADGYENQMGNAKQVVQDFYAELGKDFLPTFISALKTGVEVLQNFSSIWKGLPGPVKTVLVAIGGFLAVISVIAPTISALITIFSALGGLFAGGGALAAVGTFFTATLLPAIPIILAVVAAVVAVIAIIKNWGAITDWLSEKWTTFTTWLSGIWTSISTTASTVWTAITTTISGAWKNLVAIASSIFQPLATFFSGLWNGIKNVVTTVWNAVVGLLSNIWNTISNVAKSIFNPIASFFTSIWNGIKNVASNVWNAIKSTLSNVWNGIKASASSIFNALASFLSGLWNGIKNTASSIWNGIKSTISGVANGIKSTVTNVFNGLKGSVSNIFNGIKNAMTGPVEAAKNTISGIIDRIKGFFSGIRLRLPKIDMPPLPHFKLSGSFSLKPPSVPHLSVDWYKKGSVFNGPNVIGVGEAGPEAVLPLNDPVLGSIGRMIAERMPEGSGKSSQVIQNEFTIEINGNVDSEVTARRMVDDIMDRITEKYNNQNSAFS